MAKRIALAGIGSDNHSSFLKGAAQAPPIIREALFSASSNSFSESGSNVLDETVLTDLGDMSFLETKEHMPQVEAFVEQLIDDGYLPILLGGDHAITFPVVKAMSGKHEAMTILHFDAHPDLYDEFDGDRYSHACPFARIMELGCVNRLVQVGIRTLNAHQREQVKRFGVECYDMLYLERQPLELTLSGPVYISIDLDCLDPAFAPGVSHREPGGLSSRDVIRILHQLLDQDCYLIGADVVEYNPQTDFQGMTAVVAAKFVKELIGIAINR